MPINPDAVGSTSAPATTTWTSKDAILYAVGVGAGVGLDTDRALWVSLYRPIPLWFALNAFNQCIRLFLVHAIPPYQYEGPSIASSKRQRLGPRLGKCVGAKRALDDATAKTGLQVCGNALPERPEAGRCTA